MKKGFSAAFVLALSLLVLPAHAYTQKIGAPPRKPVAMAPAKKAGGWMGRIKNWWHDVKAFMARIFQVDQKTQQHKATVERNERVLARADSEREARQLPKGSEINKKAKAANKASKEYTKATHQLVKTRKDELRKVADKLEKKEKDVAEKAQKADTKIQAYLEAL